MNWHACIHACSGQHPPKFFLFHSQVATMASHGLLTAHEFSMRQHTSERRDRINDGKPAHDASFTPLTNAGNSLAASKLAIKDVLAGQLPALAEVFASADRNLSGWVAREAVYDWLVAIAERVGIHDVTARTIEAVIDDFDPSGDGKDQIRYDEWTRLVLRDALFRASTRLIHFIRARDREGKGGVDKALLRHAICAFGLPASRELLDCVFDEMDLERTGWLRYEELQAKLKLGSAVRLANKGYTGQVYELTARCASPLRSSSLLEQFLDLNACPRPPASALRTHNPWMAHAEPRTEAHNPDSKPRTTHWRGELYSAPCVVKSAPTRAEVRPLSQPRQSIDAFGNGQYVGTSPSGEAYYIEREGGGSGSSLDRVAADTAAGWGGLLEYKQWPNARRRAIETAQRHGRPLPSPVPAIPAAPRVPSSYSALRSWSLQAKPASAELLDVLDEAEEQQQEEEGMEEGMEASSGAEERLEASVHWGDSWDDAPSAPPSRYASTAASTAASMRSDLRSTLQSPLRGLTSVPQLARSASLSSLATARDPTFFGSSTGVAIATRTAMLAPTGAVLRDLSSSRSAGTLLMKHPSWAGTPAPYTAGTERSIILASDPSGASLRQEPASLYNWVATAPLTAVSGTIAHSSTLRAAASEPALSTAALTTAALATATRPTKAPPKGGGPNPTPESTARHYKNQFWIEHELRVVRTLTREKVVCARHGKLEPESVKPLTYPRKTTPGYGGHRWKEPLEQHIPRSHSVHSNTRAYTVVPLPHEQLWTTSTGAAPVLAGATTALPRPPFLDSSSMKFWETPAVQSSSSSRSRSSSTAGPKAGVVSAGVATPLMRAGGRD